MKFSAVVTVPFAFLLCLNAESATLRIDSLGDDIFGIFLDGEELNGNFDSIFLEAIPPDGGSFSNIDLDGSDGLERRPPGDPFTYISAFLSDPIELGGNGYSIVGIEVTTSRVSFNAGPMTGVIDTANDPNVGGDGLFLANLVSEGFRANATLVSAGNIVSELTALSPGMALNWNQVGPGTYGFETADNWTPNQIPTENTDVLFPLDGDVDVIPFTTSIANNVTVSDGVVRFKSLGSTTFNTQGNVAVADPTALNLAEGAFATLDGTNGYTWSTVLDLRVGDAGFGTFIVSNGGDFDARQIVVGEQAGAAGEVTVTGADSTLVATENSDIDVYRIGTAASTGTLNVLDGASIFSRNLIGDISLGEGIGSYGTLNVDGQGSHVLIDDVVVGLGGVGLLNVTDGGLVDQSAGSEPDAYVAAKDLSADIGTGTVVVSGDDSRWNFRRGEFGSAGVGDVSVEAGGRIAASSDLAIGVADSSRGSLHVSGIGTLADSQASVGGSLFVGESGQATVTVDLGGDLTVGDDLYIGNDLHNLNHAMVAIDGQGSSLAVTDSLEVGRAGIGTLNITDGATATLESSLVAAQLAGSNGEINISGASTSVTAKDTGIAMRGTGSLTLSGGAQLEVQRFTTGQADSSKGTVNISGPDSTLTVTGLFDLASMKIGGEPNAQGGTGTMTVSQGGTLISGNDTYIGGNSTSKGSLIVTGPMSLADFNASGTNNVLAVGYAGEGSLTIHNGGRVESESATIGHMTGASGTVDVGGDGNAIANWNVEDSLFVGGQPNAAGGNGLLTIRSQGTVTVGGELKIWDAGSVFLSDPTATLSVGTMTFAPDSLFVFQQGNLVLTGNGLNINPTGILGDSVILIPGQTLATTNGGLANEGDLNVIGTAVSFIGGPSVNNSGAEINAINSTLTFDGDLMNSGDVNLINSIVNGSLINGGSGALAMIGSNSFSEQLEFAGQDSLYVDISGSNAGEFDTTAVGGLANLGGNLVVAFAGYVPSAGDTFEILTAAGGVQGAFANESLPELGGDLQWFVNYEATSVTLVATLAGDFNEDGIVNGDDLANWNSGYGSTNATHMQGDADGDGNTDGADFVIWQRQVGMGVLPQSSSQAVPEPNGIVLTLLSVLLVPARWRI